MAIRSGAPTVRALILALWLVPAGGAVAYAIHGSHSHPRPGTQRAQALAPWNSDARAILWAVRSKDLLSCRTAASILRRIQHSRAHAVPVTLVAVEADSAWAASLLHAERVDGAVRVMSERQYREGLGGSVTPMLYVLDHGRISLAVHVPREAAEDSIRMIILRALDVVAVRTDGKPH